MRECFLSSTESWKGQSCPESEPNMFESFVSTKFFFKKSSIMPDSPKLSKFKEADFALFAAGWWPRASWDEYLLMTYMAVWLFVWDDEIERMLVIAICHPTLQLRRHSGMKPRCLSSIVWDSDRLEHRHRRPTPSSAALRTSQDRFAKPLPRVRWGSRRGCVDYFSSGTYLA